MSETNPDTPEREAVERDLLDADMDAAALEAELRAVEPVPDATQAPRGPGWGGALFLSLLAAGGGALGGWALSETVEMPGTAVSAPDATAQETLGRIEGLETRLGALEARPDGESRAVADLRRRLDTLERRPAPAADTSALEARLLALETRTPAPLLVTEAGEALDGPGVSDIERRLDALERQTEAQTGAPSSGDTASSVTSGNADARLSALETQVASLADWQTGSADFAANVAELDERVTVLEATRNSEGGDGPSTAVPIVQPTLTYSTAPQSRAPQGPASAPLPPFPREAVEAALLPSGRGLRSLFRARSVQTEQALDAVEAAVAAGNRNAALSAFQTLPPPVREAAREWAVAVQDTPQDMPQETQP